MAILSFKKRFAGKVRNGSKCQTIRAFRKYPIRQGETLYLYTALRTKFAKRLRVVKCKSVNRIDISFNKPLIIIWYSTDESLALHTIYQLNEFAKADGFSDWDDMKSFWIQEHGVKKGKRKAILRIFKGNLYKW